MFGNSYMSRERRPYGKDSYGKISNRITDLQPFAGNSMHGDTNSDGQYVVYSYRTVIAIYDPADGTFYENVQHYSVTTSRHQATARSLMPSHPHSPTDARYHVECDGETATLRAARELAPY